jgi:hypothetical protein
MDNSEQSSSGLRADSSGVAGHTPGPWSQDRYGNVIDAKGIQIIATGIALTTGYCSSDEPRANARLIAAAPDLLAVVKELEESSSYWSEYDVPIGIVDRIRAAISLAQGE